MNVKSAAQLSHHLFLCWQHLTIGSWVSNVNKLINRDNSNRSWEQSKNSGIRLHQMEGVRFSDLLKEYEQTIVLQQMQKFGNLQSQRCYKSKHNLSAVDYTVIKHLKAENSKTNKLYSN